MDSVHSATCKLPYMRFLSPDDAQGVEYKTVANRQFARVRNNLAGVRNVRIQPDAPLLMSEDPFAMLTCRLRIVSVAVIPDRANVSGH